MKRLALTAFAILVVTDYSAAEEHSDRSMGNRPPTQTATAYPAPPPGLKPFTELIDRLAFRESSNRPYYVNPQGYAGLYQAGEAALRMIGYYRLDGTDINDWKGGWTGKFGIWSLEDWLASPNVQTFALVEYWNYVWDSEMPLYSLHSRIGAVVNGAPITKSGLCAGAHLIGANYLADYFKGVTQADPWGTNVEEYMVEFNGYHLPRVSEMPVPKPRT